MNTFYTKKKQGEKQAGRKKEWEKLTKNRCLRGQLRFQSTGGFQSKGLSYK